MTDRQIDRQTTNPPTSQPCWLSLAGFHLLAFTCSTHATIPHCGRPLEETAREFINGTNPCKEDWCQLRVVKRNGWLLSWDNRRLLALKEAQGCTASPISPGSQDSPASPSQPAKSSSLQPWRKFEYYKLGGGGGARSCRPANQPSSPNHKKNYHVCDVPVPRWTGALEEPSFLRCPGHNKNHHFHDAQVHPLLALGYPRIPRVLSNTC